MKHSAKKNNIDICDSVLIALRKITQSIDLHSRYLVRQFGLTGPQLVILQELSKLGEISVGDLSRAISLSQATVTGILERLENRGLIIRRRGERDKRRVMVQATEACKTLLDKAPPPIQESFIRQFGNLQDWEQTMILSALQRLVSMMDAKTLNAAPFLATGSLDAADEE
jgi:DNA-binding MarR family transcriptional regulator